MRFGGDAGKFFQLYLFRRGLSNSIYEQCKYLPNILEYMQSLGVKSTEFGLNLERMQVLFPHLKKLKKKNDITFTIHNHGGRCEETLFPVQYCYQDTTKQGRRAIKESLKWFIEMAAEFAQVIVLHLPYYYNPRKEQKLHLDPCDFFSNYVIGRSSEQARAEELFVDLLKDCGDYAYKNGVILALENLPLFARGRPLPSLITTSEQLLGLIQYVNSKGVQCTLDIGHANTTEEGPLKFIQTLRKYIVHVHLHDNDGSEDQHLPMGQGNVDFERIMPTLAEIDRLRDGKLTIRYEVSLEPEEYEKEWIRVKNSKWFN